MQYLKLQDAARQLSVSYPTLKQWIYKGKLQSVRTAGGHHRIPQSEIQRLMVTPLVSPARGGRPRGLDAISGRNKLLGRVTDVRKEGLLAQVSIDVGGQTITSIITSNACEALGLRKDVRAYALIKATEVMVIRA